MEQNIFYLSTIDPNAHVVVQRYGMGLEIAEYCTAWNMDDNFPETHALVKKKTEKCQDLTFHAPFNELFPCAIDREARSLAQRRYRQAVALARNYGAKKVVIHGGYHPKMYYPVWYVEQSIDFWKTFLQEDPGIPIVLENVLEEEPEWLVQIVEGVNNPGIGLCLDIGHVNAYSQVPVMQWLERWAPYLRHFHIHNNDGSWDSHSPLTQGTMDIREIMSRARELCPAATFTLELTNAEASVRWLLEEML